MASAAELHEQIVARLASLAVPPGDGWYSAYREALSHAAIFGDVAKFSWEKWDADRQANGTQHPSAATMSMDGLRSHLADSHGLSKANLSFGQSRDQLMSIHRMRSGDSANHTHASTGARPGAAQLAAGE